jgi:hypothetical protein
VLGLNVGTGVKVVSGCCGTMAPGAGICTGFFFLLRGVLSESKPVLPAPKPLGLP